MFKQRMPFDADGSAGGGEVTEVAEQPTEQVQEDVTPSEGFNAVTSDTGDTEPIVAVPTSRGTNLQLIKDPQTGRNKLIEVAPEEEPAEDPKDEVPKQEEVTEGLVDATQQVEKPAKTPYTTSELSVALQLGNVDEGRLTPELAVQYGQYKERMAQEQAIAKTQEVTEETSGNDKIAFIKEVDRLAKEMTLKEMGISQEDLDLAEYSDDESLAEKAALYNTYLAYNKQRIFADVQTESAKREMALTAQKSIDDSVKAFADKESASNPYFAETNNKMLTYYKELSFEKATRYYEAAKAYREGRLTAEQSKDLEDYYNDTKKAVFAAKNNLSVVPQRVVNKPPAVERPGSGKVIQPAANPADLRKMNARERAAWFLKNFPR